MLLGKRGLGMQSKSIKGHTILVSGASGIVGYGILRSLQGHGHQLIGATIYDVSPANCFSNIVLNPPRTTDSNYLPWLLEAISRYGIELVIPGIEVDMSFWNKHRDDIRKAGAFALLNTFELIEACLDKWTFYQILEKNNCKYRIDSTLKSDFNHFSLPFILKPRHGYGSRGIVKIDSFDLFVRYKDRIGNELMMQEIVGTRDEEYTVSAFFNHDSAIAACMVLRRRLSPQGFTEIAEVVPIDNSLEKIIKELACIFHPVGPTNFQFRRHNGEWKLLEINPRISSSTSIRKAFGYNESQMCIDYFLDDLVIGQPELRSGQAIRYTEDYIIYDGDNI